MRKTLFVLAFAIALSPWMAAQSKPTAAPGQMLTIDSIMRGP